MASVGIVTDSTCDLSPDELEGLGVRLVPLKVLIGEETYLDWVQMRPDEFYRRLAASAVLPKTSQPTPAEFAAAYTELAEQGCDAIVSIHLTSALSGTISSATSASKDAAVPVYVVDTKLVSQALGLIVKAAVKARDEGHDGAAIAAMAERLSRDTELFFVLDTLDYLVKGGRAGKAAGLAASLLNIKPVLRFNDDGIIEPFKKAKGRKKALSELATHVAEESKKRGRLRLSVLHACNEDQGADLIAELEAAGADFELDSRGYVGSVVGTYAGPNSVGCAYHPIA